MTADGRANAAKETRPPYTPNAQDKIEAQLDRLFSPTFQKYLWGGLGILFLIELAYQIWRANV